MRYVTMNRLGCFVSTLALAGVLVACSSDEEPERRTGETAADGGTAGAPATGRSADNVAACEAYVEQVNSLECFEGAAELDPGSTCAGYDRTTCDISDYFDCLVTNITCMDAGGTSVPDTSGTASCMDLATCD